jgi:hypothetical protein
VVREDVNFGNTEMSLVHAICAIDDKLLGSEALDKLRDFPRPLNRYIFVAKSWTAEFIAGLVSKDRGVFSISQTSVGVRCVIRCWM